ncbi:MAG: hypothetical protein KAX30_08945 [Candidatus Atribacteria bacterium]|nr:hypothetical protein [Candidatus Atribacteria bacterium]
MSKVEVRPYGCCDGGAHHMKYIYVHRWSLLRKKTNGVVIFMSKVISKMAIEITILK